MKGALLAEGQEGARTDRLGALSWGWAEGRVVDLVVHSLRFHAPQSLDGRQGSGNSQAQSDELRVAKSYRKIYLLNCLGKVVERVASVLLSRHCEERSTLHRGQFGARKKEIGGEGSGHPNHLSRGGAGPQGDYGSPLYGRSGSSPECRMEVIGKENERNGHR